MATLVLLLFRFARFLFSGHAAVAVENAALRLLASYFAYYHGSRTHLGLDKQCPSPREVSSIGEIIAIPHLGGLHHRYERIAA